MENEDLMVIVKETIAPYTEETDILENIDKDTDFIRDLKINSASLVDIVLDLEERFTIEIDNESMAKMLTVGASIEVIKTKLGEGDRE